MSRPAWAADELRPHAEAELPGLIEKLVEGPKIAFESDLGQSGREASVDETEARNAPACMIPASL